MLIDTLINGVKVKWDITRPLLTRGGANYKIAKSEKFQDGKYSTKILHLAPAKVSGFQTCPKASAGCKAICLNMAGQGGCNVDGKLHTNTCHIARSGKTTLLKTNLKYFMAKLKLELSQFILDCEAKGSKPCLRLNGTSDLNWQRIKDPETGKNIMSLFPMIQFYDYTKDIKQLKNLPDNYQLTFSRSENNLDDVLKAIELGFNIAVVFDKKQGLPETFLGLPVFNADETDLRFLDNELSKSKTPVISGLIEKGYLAKHDKSGFVIRDYVELRKAA